MMTAGSVRSLQQVGRPAAVALLTAVLGACTSPPPAAPAVGATVIDGLNSPQGVLVAADGSVWVADSGTGGGDVIATYPNPAPPAGPGGTTTLRSGMTGRVLRAVPGQPATVQATLASVAGGGEATAGGRLAELGGNVYVANGIWTKLPLATQPARVPMLAGVVKVAGGAASEVGNTWDFEVANDPYPGSVESHPYGLAAGPDGQLWIADAAANDLLKMDPATGAVTLVTVFGGVPNSSGVGPPVSEPVPTAVAFLPGGAAYVSLLPGFPFTPGSSKVVRVAPDGSKTDYATGLSTTTDLRAGPDGNLYATQLGTFGATGPVAGTGSIVRLKAGGAKETILKGLDTPTSIAFNSTGDAFIAVNGAAAPGTGKVLRYDALTGYKALP